MSLLPVRSFVRRPSVAVASLVAVVLVAGGLLAAPAGAGVASVTVTTPTRVASNGVVRVGPTYRLNNARAVRSFIKVYNSRGSEIAAGKSVVLHPGHYTEISSVVFQRRSLVTTLQPATAPIYLPGQYALGNCVVTSLTNGFEASGIATGDGIGQCTNPAYPGEILPDHFFWEYNDPALAENGVAAPYDWNTTGAVGQPYTHSVEFTSPSQTATTLRPVAGVVWSGPLVTNIRRDLVVVGPPPPLAPVPAPVSTPVPAPGASDVYYANCAAARAAGAAPISRGQPGYRPGLDRDGDGIACEDD